MRYNIEQINENEVLLKVDFSDENVDLQGEIKVKGNEADGLKYLPVFEQDLRRNFAYMFPAKFVEHEGGELL